MLQRRDASCARVSRRRVACRDRLFNLAGMSCLAACLFVLGKPASSSVPAPRNESNVKPGIIIQAESLSPDKRAVELPKGSRFPDHLKFGSYWQEPVLCGPNALFVLAKLSGLDVTREDITKLVPISETGSTLADLSKAATKLGLPHEIRKVSQSEMFRLSPPFLVHDSIRASGPEAADTGHFFVVVRFNERGQIGIVDGVSGLYQFVETARFDRSFSGYVLLPELDFLGFPARWAWSALYVLAGLVIVMSCILFYLRRPVHAQGHPSLSTTAK